MTSQLEFHVHSDLYEQRQLSSNALTAYMRCGNSTARNAADGIVPASLPSQIDYTPNEQSIDGPAAIRELVAAGLWTPVPSGGWLMEFGPSEDWDAPMQLWRYSAPMDGVEIVPGFWQFPDPDA